MRFALVLALVAGLSATPLTRNYAVEHYDVNIAPDLAAKRLTGEVTIRLHGRVDRVDALELDAGALEIAGVSDGQTPLRFERQGRLLIVALAKPVRSGEHRSIAIRYQAGPAKGLVFFPDQVYTSFFTSDWMVCNDRPDEPATLRLRIATPPKLKVVATERLDSPVPPFLYGFAVGAFAESTAQENGVKLRVMGHASVFEPTRAALRFLSERTGRPYPGDTYTQVFAHGRVEQEVAGFTLLPDSYSEDLSQHPANVWLLAHELAHQWFAVGIRCQDWSDFWLNEGLATFLADAFLEQRFGRARYEQEIESSRKIYEGLQAQGKDRPLSFHGWDTPQQAGGSLPYHKGAWVLDRLRRQLSDEVFWRGLRLYTSEHWGQSVTSEDLEKSMEKAAGKNLSEFFARWVTR